MLHDPLAGRALETLDDRDGRRELVGREAEAQPSREGGGDADHGASSTAGWESTTCSTSHADTFSPLHPTLSVEPQTAIRS